MAVKSHVLQIKLFLVSVFIDKGCFELAFAPRAEALDFNLLGEIQVVDGQSFEYRFLGAPIDGELLVPLVVFEVFNLVL